MDVSGARGGWASFHGGHSSVGDGRGSIGEIARAAAERQFIAFGFTEHFQFPPFLEFSPDGKFSPLSSRPAWLGAYVTAVQAVQAEYKTPRFLLGTELEFIHGADGWTRHQTSFWPFDYFVGSVHFMRYGEEDICIDWDRTRIDEALRRAGSPEQLYLDYYDHVLELLDWRMAHVIAHLDLIKMLLRPDEQADTPAIRQKVHGVLETMRDRGAALDINARGLIKPCRALYPADWILAAAYRVGVPITLGDDSHGPDEVGARLDQAVAAARRAGYNQMAIVQPGGTLETVDLP